MPMYVQKRPTIEAILFDGTNAQEVIDTINQGRIDDDGNLIVSLFGNEAPVSPGLYLGKADPNFPDGGPTMWTETAFTSNWEPV